MNSIKNIAVTVVAIIAACGVAANLPMKIPWVVTGACLASVGLATLVLKNIVYETAPNKVFGVIAAVSLAMTICGIAGLIPLAIIYYPAIPVIMSIYGLVVVWSMEITLLCIIIHAGLPKGILRYVIGSIAIFWTCISIITLGINALQPVLQVIIAGVLCIFVISFVIWGFQNIREVRK